MPATRVLIVEDSATQARQLGLILEDAGFEVELAPDADRGFELARDGSFEAVLSDLNLPGGSGFDLCRRIKAEPALRNLPVVVCTAEADPANVLRGLQAGADGFMTKDREPAAIVAGIRQALARPAESVDVAPTKVAFLDREYELTAGPERLLGVLVSAFEDVVQLNRRCVDAARSARQAHDALRRAHQDLKQAESQLVQAEKLSALGQMVAGVAHEINNPLAYVTNDVALLRRDVGHLRDLIRLYRKADPQLEQHAPDLLAEIRSLADSIDLDYTLDHIVGPMTRADDGLRRIRGIVKDLRDFARLDEAELKEVDLNEGVRSTINVARGLAFDRGVALEVQLGSIPPVACYPAKINQVVLNLIVNAIDACRPGGRVVVLTRPADADDFVEICVEDDGTGIEPGVIERIFDPFFTTKPVGKGTGLGLSISYGIAQAHGGRIDVDSAPGRGSRFVVRLPWRAQTHVGLA